MIKKTIIMILLSVFLFGNEIYKLEEIHTNVIARTGDAYITIGMYFSGGKEEIAKIKAINNLVLTGLITVMIRGKTIESLYSSKAIVAFSADVDKALDEFFGVKLTAFPYKIITGRDKPCKNY